MMSVRRRLRQQRGGLLFDRKTTLSLLLLFAGAYLGTRYGAPYIDNYELEKAMKAAITSARQGHGNSQIVESLMRRLRVAGLRQFNEQDVRVERVGKHVTLSTDYEAFINLGFGYGHTLPFHAQAGGFVQ